MNIPFDQLRPRSTFEAQNHEFLTQHNTQESHQLSFCSSQLHSNLPPTLQSQPQSQDQHQAHFNHNIIKQNMFDIPQPVEIFPSHLSLLDISLESGLLGGGWENSPEYLNFNDVADYSNDSDAPPLINEIKQEKIPTKTADDGISMSDIQPIPSPESTNIYQYNDMDDFSDSSLSSDLSDSDDSTYFEESIKEVSHSESISMPKVSTVLSIPFSLPSPKKCSSPPPSPPPASDTSHYSQKDSSNELKTSSKLSNPKDTVQSGQTTNKKPWKPASFANSDNVTCTNCKTTKTSLWRRDAK